LVKVGVGAGGSLLVALFILQAAIRGGFLIVAAIIFYLLITLIARKISSFGVISFSVATLAWLALMYFLLLTPLRV
jgi:hypothetical protein